MRVRFRCRVHSRSWILPSARVLKRQRRIPLQRRPFRPFHWRLPERGAERFLIKRLMSHASVSASFPEMNSRRSRCGRPSRLRARRLPGGCVWSTHRRRASDSRNVDVLARPLCSARSMPLSDRALQTQTASKTRNTNYIARTQRDVRGARYGFFGGWPDGIGVGAVGDVRPVFGDVPPGLSTGPLVVGRSTPCTVRRSTSRSSRSSSPPARAVPPPLLGDTPAPAFTGGRSDVVGVFTPCTVRFVPT